MQHCLGNLGFALAARGQHQVARVLLKEQEQICRELGDPNELQIALGYQADMLRAQGDLPGVLVLYKEIEQLCRALGNPERLALALVNQAVVLFQEMNRPQEALPLIEEAYRLASERRLSALAGQMKPLLDQIRLHAY